VALSGRHQGKSHRAARRIRDIFVGLIDDLPLRKGFDRRYLRLTVIGALSWSLFWFKKERDTPATIAKQILSMLRAGIEDAK
jgi:TetR/AcrR family transcriptional regulator, cholesterol catabolism regulator